MFTECDKQKFIGSVKTSLEKRQSILIHGMSLSDACTYAYLDLSRTPLRGIRSYLASSSSTAVRTQCIEDIILPFCRSTLFSAQQEIQFDQAHQDLSTKIWEFYTQHGYPLFTVGKPQKWINMALKYACIYDKEDADALCKIFPYCHLPIDRYIATPLVNELHVKLPAYDGFKMPKRVPFNANKHNYAWSKIDNYPEYLACQNATREALHNSNPEHCALEWEFDWWLKEKQNHI